MKLCPLKCLNHHQIHPGLKNTQKTPVSMASYKTSPKRSVQVTPSRLPSNVKQPNEKKKKSIKILPKEFRKSRETVCDF